MATAPEELTVQLGLIGGPDGVPLVMVVPTWSGLPEQGDARLAPFLGLGTLVDQHLGCNGLRHLARNLRSVSRDRPTRVHGDVLASERSTARGSTPSFARWRRRLHRAVPSSPHEFRAPPRACRLAATAFGLRRNHVLVEILASFTDRSEPA
jgi:hypothetical protein